jgi:serine protease Do
MRSGKITIILVCGASVAAILVANLGTDRPPPDPVEAPVVNAGAGQSAPATARGRPQRAAVQRGLRDVVSALRPAVVNISAHPKVIGPAGSSGAQLLDSYPARGGWVGSGVIVDAAGHILSCRQATGDADIVRVTLFRSGHNSFLARRLATDPATDLVLLQLTFGGDLPYAVLAESSRVRTGDLVIALGSPFGLAETVTQGIVSASRRTVSMGQHRFPNLIQTDAAINQGNCGGPLVNIHAEVIGLNLAIYSTDSAFSGIGFAIPSDQARAFLQRVIGFRG